MVQKILTHKPPDVVDNFEQFSWEVKEEKLRPNFDLLNDVYLSPPQLELMRKLDDMFKLVASKSQKLEEVGEEEQELDLEEESTKPRISDCGFGLPESECYALYIALNMLTIKEPVATVRFFGKIFGTNADYYVAETDLTIEELDRRIREFDMKDMPGEGEGEGQPEEPDNEAEERKEIRSYLIKPYHDFYFSLPMKLNKRIAFLPLVGEGEERELKTKELVPPKLPPLPVSTWTPEPPIPVERPGQGVNKKVLLK
ncbi:Radial spoke head protein 4-like A [Papilio machaon]|uniref:Radial spoke head protein 4-like A n=1 Tax=Papilio machaon TaxID=76193 RepID=A0A194RI57_PAPMA|nr:Radial spoke head protein 4-like A [Papilio machaon]